MPSPHLFSLRSTLYINSWFSSAFCCFSKPQLNYQCWVLGFILSLCNVHSWHSTEIRESNVPPMLLVIIKSVPLKWPWGKIKWPRGYDMITFIVFTLLKSLPSSKMGSLIHGDYVKQVPGPEGCEAVHKKQKSFKQQDPHQGTAWGRLEFRVLLRTQKTRDLTSGLCLMSWISSSRATCCYETSFHK